MEASSVGMHEYGGRGRWVKYWAHLGCWISPHYRPFSLGRRFETYEPFIPLIFQFYFGPRWTAGNWNRRYWISGYGGMPVYSCIACLQLQLCMHEKRSANINIKKYIVQWCRLNSGGSRLCPLTGSCKRSSELRDVSWNDGVHNSVDLSAYRGFMQSGPYIEFTRLVFRWQQHKFPC
jgi:hypothetical protein